MLKVIDSPEKLWQSCAELSKDLDVTYSELFGRPKEHLVLAYGPVAQRNQYQALLYSAHNIFNVSLLPIHKLDLCGEIPWPGKVVCHFHWLHDKTKRAKTEDEANEAVVYWEKLIRRIKENGHKIVWTVHNVMPHETVWVEQDKQIHQLVADAADAVHIMASDSANLTEQYYLLNERKTFLVPHPTYEGAQPDKITREEARKKLQIKKDEFVFLSFGAIMEYKGYDRLMSAYDCLRDRSKYKVRLIVAGLPSDRDLVDKIKKWGENKEEVILDMTPVPSEDIQVYFRSADYSVCPYYRTMNSGAAMMAITFDVPVIGPNSGGFLDLEKSGCGITFDNSKLSSLIDVMQDLVERKKISSEALARSKQKLSPCSISQSFFQSVQSLVHHGSL
ncbi:glycosyltransferase [Microbulbifer echini]|uniref:Glycosyltransferase n=1 Tax=Microbulbifer echini TaxID=1529067 RepID=A0ABV4NI63_9GAMM